jgi:hypothetical protein
MKGGELAGVGAIFIKRQAKQQVISKKENM